MDGFQVVQPRSLLHLLLDRLAHVTLVVMKNNNFMAYFDRMSFTVLSAVL